MIAFSCARCAMKFQVKDEFAGRSTRCPTCTNPLTVPTAPAAAVAPPSHFDGPLSTLARARLACDVTLGGPPPVSNGAAARPVAAVLADRQADGQRYVLEGEIARGGMGAVLRAVDRDIRREVAVKYLLDQSDPRKKVRFVEEAQVTGQLEHPNIVPIHELGADAQGRLFFSMKMVRGRSLQQILQELRDSPRSAAKEWPLGRLLTVFVNVCNALAYAHSRDVVHRDLKPANIMVGDFGEVYVMDWGLAKVLSRPAPAEPTAVIRPAPSFAWAEGAEGSAASSQTVRTSRQESDDRTMDGAILGTPLYMAPEQAQGKLDAIGPRTDVYALGAILYEMLALLPPIDRQGGAVLILARVMKGEIVPPEKLAPGRRIPLELSAVALKALAKEPPERYASVEALRRDVELYQEGRSVSAREDTQWEIVRKFVKRHRGFSAGMAMTLLVLLCSLWFLAQAWLGTSRAYAGYRQAQEEQRAQAKRSVPAFVRAARLAISERQFEDALAQVNVALDFDPDSTEAGLLRAQLLIAQQQYAEAGAALREVLRRRPDDADAQRLAALCQRARKDDWTTLLGLVEALDRSRVRPLADVVLANIKASQKARQEWREARQKLLEVYRRRIETAWPGLGPGLSFSVEDGSTFRFTATGGKVSDLSPLEGMPLSDLDLYVNRKVRDLSPLKGMKLTRLNLHSCGEVRDLSPLKDMPLNYLDISACGLSDLSPLKGMPLTTLHLTLSRKVRDRSPLKGMPLTEIGLPPLVDRGMSLLRQIKTLGKIDGMPAAAFWKKYDAGAFPQYKP